MLTVKEGELVIEKDGDYFSLTWYLGKRIVTEEMLSQLTHYRLAKGRLTVYLYGEDIEKRLRDAENIVLRGATREDGSKTNSGFSETETDTETEGNTGTD